MSSLEREFRIYAMCRSGHHAVIYWLLSQFEESKVVFLNNVGYRRGVFDHDNCGVMNPQSLGKDNIEMYMLSFEEPSLRSFQLDNVTNPLLNRCNNIKNVIILRDPFNNFASKFKRDFNKDFSNVIDKYLQLANNKKFYKILYNNWFKDEKYRKKILIDLDLPLNNLSSFEHVPPQGSGSSFNDFEFQNKGSQMGVLNRYKEFLNNPIYIELFRKNYQLVRTSQKIFNFYPKDLEEKINAYKQ